MDPTRCVRVTRRKNKRNSTLHFSSFNIRHLLLVLSNSVLHIVLKVHHVANKILTSQHRLESLIATGHMFILCRHAFFWSSAAHMFPPSPIIHVSPITFCLCVSFFLCFFFPCSSYTMRSLCALVCHLHMRYAAAAATTSASSSVT